jgi:UDP-N-acetylmuramoyl-L-alanyl-D-glutamate--2,6-diaminopimelate ligase
VLPGYAFVAIGGESTYVNRNIDAGFAKGAVAVASDSAAVPQRENIAWAQVVHGRRALARLSANFYHRPAQRLNITGITGTNGKTTTAFLLDSILTAARRKTALAGTIEYRIGQRVTPSPRTTPEALELNRFFAQAVQENAVEAVMEVSSHALAQERVYGIFYDVAVFTNLTQDHLDYHRNLDDYFAAKAKLFEGVGTDPPRVAVLNADDPFSARLVQLAKSRHSEILTYGLEQGDFRAENADLGLSGTRFDMVTPRRKVSIFSPLVGRVNLHNIMAAAGRHSRAVC